MIEQCIFNQFLAQARHHPDAIAVRTVNRTFSYAELNILSVHLSARLLQSNNQQNKIIAFYGKRSATLIVSILACARAGLTFAVLDSAYPKERIMRMAEVIKPAIIVGIDTTDKELTEVFDEFSDETPVLSVDDAYLTRIKSLPVGIEESPAFDVDINQTAYLLFTSGTTGLPKCIKTSHRPLVHFVDWYVKTFNVKHGTKFSMLSGLGHDPVLRDIFMPLSTGGEINIPEADIITNPIKLFQWMQSSEIAYLHTTPQLLRLLCAGAKKGDVLPYLRYIFSGGDALRISHVTELRKLASQCKIVNFYGTTETPQAMAFHELKANDIDDPIPIGKGIADVKVHILSQDLKAAAMGETGQIGIETAYLSDGYLDDQALTNGRFIVSADSQQANNMIYLTGDNGMCRADGSIVLQGRMDDQVKIRGFRVELGEVVAALESETAIQSAAVLAQQAQNGENYLVAYLVKPKELEANNAFIEQIKTSLTTKLPAYMVPNHYVWLDALPLLPNGKLDRTKLPVVEQQNSLVPEDEDADVNSTEYMLNRQWKTILNTSTLDTRKSFVELGGDSLSYIQATLAIEKSIGWLPEDWEKMPLKTIAKLPKKMGSKSYEVGMPIIIRALSIILIVVEHAIADLTNTADFTITGTTAALFIVAGWSFGKYQANLILKNNSVFASYSSLVKILLPSITYLFLLQITHEGIDWPSLLLVSNFISFENYGNYWFVMVLVQCLIILSVLFSFQKIRSLFSKNQFNFAITATIIGIVAALTIPHLWNTNSLMDRVPHMKLWYMFLGMSIAYASSSKDKTILVAITIFAFLGIWFFGELYTWIPREAFFSPWPKNNTFPLIPMIATLLLINVPRLPIQTSLAKIINIIAASSLFIYLAQHQFFNLAYKLHLPKEALLLCIFAVIGGIVFWKCWELSTHLIVNWYELFRNRIKAKSAEAFKQML